MRLPRLPRTPTSSIFVVDFEEMKGIETVRRQKLREATHPEDALLVMTALEMEAGSWTSRDSWSSTAVLAPLPEATADPQEGVRSHHPPLWWIWIASAEK